MERNVTFASLITEKLTQELKLSGSLSLRDMNTAGSSLIPRPSVHEHVLPSTEWKKKVSFSLGKATLWVKIARAEVFARAATTLAFKPEARLHATILQCTSGAGVPLALRTRHTGAQQGCRAWMLNLRPVGCFIPRYKQVLRPCCMRCHVGASHALNR